MSETGAYEKDNDKKKDETQNSDGSDIEVCFSASHGMVFIHIV